MHLLQQAGRCERVEIAANGHVRDGEQLGQLADAHGALAAELLDDQLVALCREHGSLQVGDRTILNATAQVPSSANHNICLGP